MWTWQAKDWMWIYELYLFMANKTPSGGWWWLWSTLCVCMRERERVFCVAVVIFDCTLSLVHGTECCTFRKFNQTTSRKDSNQTLQKKHGKIPSECLRKENKCTNWTISIGGKMVNSRNTNFMSLNKCKANKQEKYFSIQTNKQKTCNQTQVGSKHLTS